MNEKTLEGYYLIAMTGEATDSNREFTEEEEIRYAELNKEYEDNGLFPESPLKYLQVGEVYDGTGVVLDPTSRTLYLLDKTLTDEELLEIVDFHHKVNYSIYQINQERIMNGDDWESRMALMDDAEVDKVYLTMSGANLDISGAYSRSLTEDEELLQIIDYDHKATYCISRIGQEIQMGFRKYYPGYEDAVQGLTGAPSNYKRHVAWQLKEFVTSVLTCAVSGGNLIRDGTEYKYTYYNRYRK